MLSQILKLQETKSYISAFDAHKSYISTDARKSHLSNETDSKQL